MIKKGWLFVLPWSPEAIGGVSVVVVELCKAINRQSQYKPYILVEDWSAKRPKIIEKSDYIEIKNRLRSYSSVFGREKISFLLHYPNTLFTLLKIIKYYNIQVINPHYPSLSIMNLLLLKLLIKKIHFILSFHGSDLSDIMHKMNEVKAWHFIFEHVERVISCSRGMSERLMSVFPQITAKSDHIHNGISSHFFMPICRRLKSVDYKLPSKFILSVGTFEYKKGQDVLIKAFAVIAHTFKDISLVLVGRAENELASYKQLTKELLLENRIYFYENIQPEHMIYFYSKAHLYVSSAREEPFGMAMLEAAALHVPVIASKTDGGCEIIENDVDGKLVDTNSVIELTERITELLSDNKKRDFFASNLFKKAKYQYTWDNALKKYLPEN
jgi:glycosyltransferase involved in cell wall biosynthesis